ncbi:MAG TPA: hypothetical protein VF054_07240 [Micromonosporaceae bacterium]
MTAWIEYQEAARRLDALRQQIDSAKAEHARTAQGGRAELDGVQQRLALHRVRLSDVAVRTGQPVPVLVPTPAEIDAATATLTGGTGGTPSPDSAVVALRAARDALDRADAILTDLDSRHARPARTPVWRNAAIYAAYTAVMLIVQVPGIVLLLRERPAGIIALCGVVLPVVAFALGWVTVGALSGRPAPGAPPQSRSALLGAAISLVAAAPVALLAIYAIVQALRH